MRRRKAARRVLLADWVRLGTCMLTFGTALIEFLMR
jgi:hypothetical protein